MQELRQLIWDKWGKSFEVRIQNRARRTYIHVMWKYLEQKSFHLTDDEYQEQLDAVAELVALWGFSDVVRKGIASADKNGPGYTAGGAARAIQIPLGTGLDMLGGGR